MTTDCAGIERYLEPYADEELGPSEVALVETHLASCPLCQDQVAQHRRFRQLLRRQPREQASPEFRARVRRAIGRRARVRALAPWIGGAVAAAVIAAVVGGASLSSAPPPIVRELVAKHLTYAQIEVPAELSAGDPGVVRDWFHARLGVWVTVPDYAPAGIHLLGGRIADAGGRRAAYLLYEKGRTLMSVFAVPGERFAPARTRTVRYGEFDYFTADLGGLHTIFWSEGGTVFGLVSALDTDALLECAGRLRHLRGEERRA